MKCSNTFIISMDTTLVLYGILCFNIWYSYGTFVHTRFVLFCFLTPIPSPILPSFLPLFFTRPRPTDRRYDIILCIFLLIYTIFSSYSYFILYILIPVSVNCD